MKKIHFLTMVTAAVLLALAACKSDPISHLTDGVTVVTKTPEYISDNAAVCGAEVTANDNGLLLELGVCWSKNEKPTVDDQCSKTPKCSQPYMCFPNRNFKTHIALTNWAMTVAMAAPLTPMLKTKINSGSSTMLMIAPIITVSIPVRA